MSDASVLIVDDEFYTRKVLRTLLLGLGVGTVHIASDAPAGLDAICIFDPDVILLDWDMPGMNGAEFVTRIRVHSEFPRPYVPIIMLTVHSERWRVRDAVRLGVHEFLLKPVSERALIARMDSVLSRPRATLHGGGRGRTETMHPRDGVAYKSQVGG